MTGYLAAIAVVACSELALGAYLLPARVPAAVQRRHAVLVDLQYNPGISLAESNRLGVDRRAADRDKCRRSRSVGRRTGRAELDEHAEGVHQSARSTSTSPARDASKEEVYAAHSRQRLSVLPVSVAIGQPIAHRLDHLRSGVQRTDCRQDFRRGPRHAALISPRRCAQRLPSVPGLVDLQVEKQVLIPQLRRSTSDYERAALYGITPGCA